MPIADLRDITYGFHLFTEDELAAFNRPKWRWEQKYYFQVEPASLSLHRFGCRFVTYIVEASKLLPFYLENFRAKGGVVVARKLENLDEIAADFDVVINCSGLGAHHLENDPLVHPIRGHIIRVSCWPIDGITRSTLWLFIEY